MIRSSRIPSVLNRVCKDDPLIENTMLLTVHGELLGASSCTAPTWALSKIWEEYDHNNTNLNCLLLEMEEGILTVMPVGNVLVVTQSRPEAPLGQVHVRAKLLAAHVQEALSNTQITSTEEPLVANNTNQ